jgi:hypothetical protein
MKQSSENIVTRYIPGLGLDSGPSPAAYLPGLGRSALLKTKLNIQLNPL